MTHAEIREIPVKDRRRVRCSGAFGSCRKMPRYSLAWRSAVMTAPAFAPLCEKHVAMKFDLAPPVLTPGGLPDRKGGGR